MIADGQQILLEKDKKTKKKFYLCRSFPSNMEKIILVNILFKEIGQTKKNIQLFYFHLKPYLHEYTQLFNKHILLRILFFPAKNGVENFRVF